MTKEVLTLALEALKLSDTVFYPQTKIAIAAIERAIVNHIEDNLAMVAKPTTQEYAMGYAEGFNDACKPKQGEPVAWSSPQRTWVGLTHEEHMKIMTGSMTTLSRMAAVEAKLRDKNT